MLAAIESLLSAVVADGMIGGRHRSNMELVAQGVANIASPLFGGIPATGAIARTATNIKNGGRTPMAGMTHAVTLLLITLFFGRYAALIPLATLAAILVVVAYHMSEWRTFRAELRAPKSDVAVLLTTFSLTVLVDLTVAIAVGMVLAAFLFIRRMATVTNVNIFSGGVEDDLSLDPAEPWRMAIPRGVSVFEINGPFFFGAVETFRETLDHLAEHPQRADHPDARRARAGLDRHARAQRCRSSQPRSRDPTCFSPTCSRSRSPRSPRQARSRRSVRRMSFPEIDDALARAYELVADVNALSASRSTH